MRNWVFHYSTGVDFSFRKFFLFSRFLPNWIDCCLCVGAVSVLDLAKSIRQQYFIIFELYFGTAVQAGGQHFFSLLPTACFLHITSCDSNEIDKRHSIEERENRSGENKKQIVCLLLCFLRKSVRSVCVFLCGCSLCRMYDIGVAVVRTDESTRAEVTAQCR